VAEYVFAGRKYRSQADAEETLRGQSGRVATQQRENDYLRHELAEMQQQMVALRGLVGPQGAQGASQQPETQAEAAQSLADELVKSGELQFIQQIAENPEMGIGHAFYALTQALEKRMEAREANLRESVIQPITMQRDTTQAIDRSLGVTRQLAEFFPELDPSNQSEEAQYAQQEVLEVVKQFPPDMLIKNPEFVLGISALAYREMNGTPTFAQQPGSSGAPSAFAAEAAEASMPGAAPLEGSAVPRPGGAETAQDRMRRAKQASTPMVRSASGRALFRAE
jgi:hypothetical protein